MGSEDKQKSVPSLSISLDGVSGKKRSWAVREYLAELMRVDVNLIEPEDSFKYNATLKLLPDVTFGSAFSSAVLSHRTKSLMKDGQDDLVLVVPEGRITVQLPSRDDVVVGAGDAVLFSQARELRLIYQDNAPTWAVRVPHKNMARMLVGLSSAPVLGIRKNSPAMDLFRRYRRFLDAAPLGHELEQEMASRHLQEIMAAVIRHSDQFVREAEGYGLTAVRLRTMKEDIAAHLGDVRIDLNWLAAQQGVTPRYIQKLFESDGTSFSDYLRRTRLARVHSMLVDPRFNDRTISAIAHECGFPEASTMNRAFRAEYSMTPSELRGRN